MEQDKHVRSEALDRLEAFVGEWTLEAAFPDAPPTDSRGQVTFEWLLDGQFLVQRSTIPHPDAPDSFAVISADDEGEGYTQHYFDSRGVARLYAMTLSDGVWKLLRDSPDFTPLSFSQRFTASFSDDGNTIDGAWETSDDDSSWEHDFGLTFRRVT
jgi:hypothetical protein